MKLKRVKIYNRGMPNREVCRIWSLEQTWWGRRVVDWEYRREKMCEKESFFCPHEKCEHYNNPAKYGRKCYHGPNCWKGYLDIMIVIWADWWKWKWDQFKGLVNWILRRKV